ncbi:MAG: TonB-dependent receptor SusC [Candidatus Ordinivivax streblomastigis]|uniref:TonB-dependent receptor SusC n=1 Tax=Candidatus Ordinivivax streblomastigis TaxID=2540710 RepID=A0A5M8NWQ4_9BACT|nr:MAG: TonB-dependent receptor SusC [Candidatus Ordinivivax streblomastigis]KAA6301143.1 MAG: TonB-dependent receptor SusC [Candidatus Ordinivivax streblomastigis]
MKQNKRILKNQINLLLCLICFFQFTISANAQQTNRIRGQITDDTGETLIGATVLIKGTQNATITDINGNYSLNYADKNAVLVITYLGFKPYETAINGQTVINITMNSNDNMLEEVVVSVAYGTQKKVTLTGAISVVSGDDLIKMPVANVANMLSGSMPGISTISYSGQPGADNPEVFIRGMSTFNKDASAPLYLIDGVERDFFQLDPNEIESISILKDASVTAVYGVRGANGVILVTTKRGTEGRAKISGSFSYGIQQATRLLDFANSYEYALYKDEANFNDYGTYLFQQGASVADDLANPNSPLYQIKNHTNPLIYSDTDWMKMILNQSAPQTISNVNVSGGTNKVRYFTSVGLLTQDGLFKNFDADYNGNFYYHRYNYRTNLDVDFTSTSTLSLNLGGRLEEKNRPRSAEDQDQLFRRINWSNPLAGLGVVDGKWIKANSLYNRVGGSDGLQPYYGMGFSYAVENVLNLDLAYTQDLKMLTPGLKFSLKGAYNSGNTQKKERSSSIEYYVPTYKKDMGWLPDSTTNPDELVLVQNGTRGTLSYDESSSVWRNWYIEGAVNYNRTFGKHEVSGLLLANQNVKYYPAGDYPGVTNSYAGLVGRVIYNYNTTYLADFSIGYNGSENFASNRRYGIFPAGSAGWIITNEPFFPELNWLSYFKIRASYGVVGNDRGNNNSRFLYLPNTWLKENIWGNRGDHDPSYHYNFGTGGNWQQGITESLIGNPIVTWEKAYKQDYGFDFTMFNSRLSGTVDYYYENREDILYEASSSVSLGMALPQLNLGKMQNEGVELDLKWNDKIDKVQYGAKFNAAYTKNTVVYMDEVLSPYPYANKTGHSINQNFGYKVKGFYYEGMENDLKEPLANQSDYELKPGDVVYEDLNHDGKIDTDDMCALGYPNYPLLTGGLTLEAKWNNFDFSVLFTAGALTSRLLQSSFREPLDETADRALMQYQFDNRWTSPETVNANTLPRASVKSRSNNYAASELYIRDADYIRLKNFQIGYNFNAPFMKKLALKQFRLYVTGFNLFTWDKLKILDPEMYTRERSDYPVMRIINFGINATF